jgi:hypothetical protein
MGQRVFAHDTCSNKTVALNYVFHKLWRVKQTSQQPNKEDESDKGILPVADVNESLHL